MRYAAERVWREGAALRIHELVLTVGDVDEAVRFYTEVVGLELVRTVEQDGVSAAELDAGGVRLSLVPGAGPDTHVAFATDDLAARHRELRRSDAQCDRSPAATGEGTWLGFRDPWGNQLGLWEDADEQRG